MRIVVGEVAHLVDVDVATVAVVEVDEDVLGVEVGPGDGAGVQVAQLQADTYRHISNRIDECSEQVNTFQFYVTPPLH